MKRIITIISSVFFLALVGGCSGEEQKTESGKLSGTVNRQVTPVAKAPHAAPVFRTINSTEAQSLIGARKDLLMVDLREAHELKEGYLSGSILIPMSKLSDGSQVLPKDRPLLLICAVGGRSFGVGKYFSAKGYPEIYNLKGGISAWKRAGLPLQYN